MGSPWCLGNMVNKCKVLVKDVGRWVLGVGVGFLGVGVGVGVGCLGCFGFGFGSLFFGLCSSQAFTHFIPKVTICFCIFTGIFRVFVVRVIP